MNITVVLSEDDSNFLREDSDDLYQIWIHSMTKPTKWMCAQRWLRSAWASAQSDQSLRFMLSG